MENDRPSKRIRCGTPDSDLLHQTLLGEHGVDEDDFWTTAAFYSMVDDAVGDETRSPARRSSKRKRNSSLNGSGPATPYDLEDLFPGAAPSVPSRKTRTVQLSVANPYVHGQGGDLTEHPRLASRSYPVVLPANGGVNGLVKFRVRLDDPKMPERTKVLLAQHRRNFTEKMKTKAGEVSYLPPDFGRGLNLDPVDTKLLKFYLVAFCTGRTLLPVSNAWLTGIPAMAQKSDCVKHAMLSLAAGYVLDYAPSEKLKVRATQHHQKAIALVGQELNKPENYEPGKEEPLLMALSALNHIDGVHWETRNSSKEMQLWYRGTRTVKLLLDQSDPGYRYQKPMNVQSTMTRYAMGHYQAKRLLLSDTCAPLDLDVDDCPYPWLLEGSERDVRRIVGISGCCAKILHVFVQITHLTACLVKNPQSVIIPLAGKILLERLRNFPQWSDLSEGFETRDALFDACEADMDADGKVKSAALSVCLNAEGYVAAAQIYLLCRLFRKPRSDPEVQANLRALVKCVDYVPLEGPLYTAQDSLYTLVFLGLIATSPEHREIVRFQFDSLEDGPRSNTPPVWRSIKHIWAWMDTEFVEAGLDDTRPIGDRFPWWEEMVRRIMATEGRLNLN